MRKKTRDTRTIVSRNLTTDRALSRLRETVEQQYLENIFPIPTEDRCLASDRRSRAWRGSFGIVEQKRHTKNLVDNDRRKAILEVVL